MEAYKKLQDNHFDRFKDRVYDNGILRPKLKSWNEFHTITMIYFDNRADYIWRGHRLEKWDLRSLFDRESSILITHKPNRQDKLEEIFHRFKQRLKDLSYANIDSTPDDEIWAIGQHYGLPTPLLDWTECPYIAAFMAFCKKGTEKPSDNRVVYALNKSLKLLMHKNKLKKKCRKTGKPLPSETISTGRFVEFLDLAKTSDEMQNERLKRQKGRFTKSLDGMDVKTHILKFANIRKDILKTKQVILAEILIPEKERDKCLNYLREEKEMTHGRLFPDYSGAVEICRDDLGVDRIRGK